MNNNLKICQFISGDLWGGAESVTYSLIKALFQRGLFDVIVVTLNKGRLYYKIKKLGIKTFVLEERNLHTTTIVYQFMKIVEQNKINVVHTHGYKETFIAGLATLWTRKTRIFRTHHGLGMLKKRGKKYLIEAMNKKYFKVQNIVVSKDLQNQLLDIGFKEKRVHLIYNGLDKNDIFVSKHSEKLIKLELGIANSHFIIGTAGRMVEVKRHTLLLQAVAKLIKKYKNITLIIAGDGPEYNRVKNQVKKLSIEQNVKLTGFRKDIHEIINCFDIFCLSSKHEGIPMVLLEAMLLKIPVVSTAVGGVPEMIRNNINGILVASGKPDRISDAVETIFKNPELGKQLAKEGYNKVKSTFNIDTTIQRLVKLYGETF